MKPVFSRAAKRLILLVVLCGLGGCVAYAPGQSASSGVYSYYDSKGDLVHVTSRVVAQADTGPVYVEPGYVQPVYNEPVYVSAAPVYVERAPVYVAPPVVFSLGFSQSWGGGYYGGYRGYRGYRGGHRGYYGHHGGRHHH